ncbi:RING finger and CHY zinc finger domain-containing protein 1-like [Dorcoceras hygrometricum]|uniref:RING finger and CHY zinc finger domain-containing protein 1-like n=1 Tax=Dorcoceras hygrometricum TaxID=472368 RepID=A0A2Z7C3A9_9LAMI|nr:RING finger and CHY zinc finger domain-containing protein 1-like [Dorcoceras hygrometricum]
MTVLPLNSGKPRTCVTLNGSGILLAVGPQPLWLRDHNSGPAQRIMVKRLATSPHDPLGITDSSCKNQSVVVSVQYGRINPYIPIRSTTIGKSRVAIDPIAMHTSWRSNSDIASVTSIGYPRMSASGEFSTTMHRLLHASGSHPIPTPYDPKTNQYNQDLGLIHSTNGNHLESPNEGSSIDHQPPPVTAAYRDRTCSDRRVGEIPFVSNSSVLLVQADEGFVLPVVDLIRRSTAAYLLKCRFPCETGQSQAPRRQQAYLFMEVRTSMSYVSPSSSSEGSTRRFDLHLMYRPDPAPAAARTPRLHQPSAVTHLFYAYVRKATNTEFNLVVLGRDLILAFCHLVSATAEPCLPAARLCFPAAGLVIPSAGKLTRNSWCNIVLALQKLNHLLLIAIIDPTFSRLPDFYYSSNCCFSISVTTDFIYCSILISLVALRLIYICSVWFQILATGFSLAMRYVCYLLVSLKRLPAGYYHHKIHRLNLSAKAKRCRIHLSKRHRLTTPNIKFQRLVLLLSSTTDQTSHFRMRPVLFPPKRPNEQDSLLPTTCWFPLRDVPTGYYHRKIHRLNLSAKAKCCRIHLSKRHRLTTANIKFQRLFGHQCPTSLLLTPRKVPLEDLIYTSCTDPIPQPAAARTPRLHQPSAVTHLFYAYVRKATNTEFNVIVLGRDLILVSDSLAKQLRTSLKICE